MKIIQTIKNYQTLTQSKQKKVKISKVKTQNQLKIRKVEANNKDFNRFQVDFYYPKYKKIQEQIQRRILKNN